VYCKAGQLHRFPFPVHRHDALVRHSARFEIGFPLPEGKTEGDIPGYHCWRNSISTASDGPVDASEAWKNPAKRDFFFGAHDTNRVFFTYAATFASRPIRRAIP